VKLLLALLLAVDPGVTTVKQGKGRGTNDAWSVECTNCGGSGGSSSGGAVYVLDAGVLNVNPVGIAGQVSMNIVDAGAPLNVNPPASLPLPTGAATGTKQDTGNTSLSSIDAQLAIIKAKTDNLDVALSTRTKPADQQHVVVDSAPTTAVTGPLTDTQIRATPLPVSGTVTASGPVTDTQLRATPVPVSGTVTASGPVTDTQLRAAPVPVSLASAPITPVTGTFFQTTQPVSTPDGGTTWSTALPDAGVPASDDAAQRAAVDLMAIRQLLEQLVQLQQQQAVQLQALKDPGK
jgi:hypothetical protein